jgi:hypothetical protein
MALFADAGAARRRAQRWAGLFLLYLAFAVAATHPLALRARDHLFGEGSPPLNVWSMGWVLHQLPRDPIHLFDANAFHPYARTLAFSEHLLVPALLGAPVALLTGNLVLTHNVVALASLALAGLGMHLLARKLTGDDIAALGAGLLYAFHTWNLNELARIQILSNQWFPLVLLALLRFFEHPSPRRAAVAAVLYLLQALSCMYWALYLPLLVGPVLAGLAWRHRPPLRSLVPLVAALGAALLLSALFALPYLRNGRELGLERGVPESLRPGRYLDVLPGNLLYARALGTALPNQNAAHFLGFLGMGLGLLGLVRGDWAREHAALGRPLALLFAAGLLLSLGPELRWGETVLGPGPYALLRSWAPGFRNVRYPERFSLFAVLGLAPLVAAGLAATRRHVGSAAAAGLALLLFVEHFSAPLKLSPVPVGDAIPAVYRWLASDAGARVTAEVPASRFHLERLDALPMYLSTVHWKRTVQGFTGYFPPTYNFTKWRLLHVPDPESLMFLARLGVDTVLVAPEGGRPPEWATDDPRWERHGPFPEGHVALRLRAAGAAGFSAPPSDASGFAEIDRREWVVQASRPGAEAAVDGDEDTAWTTADEQGRGDFYRIRLARPAPVARIAMGVGSPFCFPMRFKVLGETQGDWVELPFDREAAYDRLFSSLLFEPRVPRLVVDLEGRTVDGIRIRITETDPFRMPWAMSEVRLFERVRGR